MNKFKTLGILALLLLSVTVPTFAQTTTTTTTLSAAITTPSPNIPASTVITVASATGITGNANATAATPASGLYIDNEYMLVRTVNSTTLQVLRGQAGTLAQPHASGAIVWIGPAGASGPFISGAGNGRPQNGGACTATSEVYLPQIDVLLGQVFQCIQSVWVAYVPAPAASTVFPRRTITANYTATTTDFYIANTTTTALATVAVTLPCATSPAGKNWIVADEGGSAGTTGFGISIIGAFATTQQILTGFTARGYTTNGTNCFRTF